MFETVVIFTAGLAIFAILRARGGVRSAATDAEFSDRTSTARTTTASSSSITCRMVIPVIQIFALYVVAHGHHSPGGGFQGGVMLGASFILFALAFGSPARACPLFGEASASVLAGGRDLHLRRHRPASACSWGGISSTTVSSTGSCRPTSETWPRSHGMLRSRDRRRLHRHGRSCSPSTPTSPRAGRWRADSDPSRITSMEFYPTASFPTSTTGSTSSS